MTGPVAVAANIEMSMGSADYMPQDHNNAPGVRPMTRTVFPQCDV